MPEIPDLPWLARYVRNSGCFANYGRAKPDAFVETRPFKTSVYMHREFRCDIDWEVGCKLYNGHLKGAADISRSEIEFLEMRARSADAEVKPEYHQDIHGMGPDDDIGAKKNKARELSESAIFVRYPDSKNADLPEVSYVVVIGAEDVSDRLISFCNGLKCRADRRWECVIVNDGNNKWAHPINNQLTDFNVESNAFHFRWINQKQRLGAKHSFERAVAGLAVGKKILKFDMSVKFSIIIPVYNVEKYLRACLDSVLAQTVGDWEAICVDDGSTDGSGAILDEYAAKDARFYVIHQENGGEGAARNTGLDAATGEWIVYLDSDDLLNPRALQAAAQIAGAECAADLLRFRYCCFTDGNERNLFNGGSMPQMSARLLKGEIPYCCATSTFASYVYRRTQFEELRFSKYCRGADRLYLGRALVLASCCADCNFEIYGYRARSGSAMLSSMDKRKMIDRIGYCLDWIDALRTSGKRVDPRIYRLIAINLTESYVHDVYSAPKPDRVELWRLWYRCLDDLASRDVACGWQRFVIACCRRVRVKPLALVLCYVPDWLKLKGIHR